MPNRLPLLPTSSTCPLLSHPLHLPSILLSTLGLPAPPRPAPDAGRGDLQPQLDSAMQDVSDMCLLMEEMEKQAVRRALVEERGRFCTFISFLQPVVVRVGPGWIGEKQLIDCSV